MENAWAAAVPAGGAGAAAPSAPPRRGLWARLAGASRAVRATARRPLTARSELLRPATAGSHAAVLSFADAVGGGAGFGEPEAPVFRKEPWGRGQRLRGVVAVALTLCGAAALIGACHWQYSALDLRVLPLPIVLAVVGAVLALGLVAAAIVFRLTLCPLDDGARRCLGLGACNQLSVSIVLALCGSALAVGEAALGEAGYLHTQLWLLPLLGCHSGMLRPRWSAAVTWLPLGGYVAVTLLSAGDSEALQHYSATAGCLLGGTLSTAGARAAGWFSLQALFCLGVCVSQARSAAAERSAWDACVYVTREEALASIEEERLETTLNLLLPPALVGRVKTRGGRRGAGGVATPLLHHHTHATVVMVEIADWVTFVRDHSAEDVATALNGLYAAFDSVLRRQASAATNGGWEGVRCEKVQAVEGRYTVAIAATAPVDSYGAQPAARAAAVVGCAVAHALGASAQRFVEEVGEVGFVSGTIGGVHVAVHQGEVASGLLGAGPVTYDLWGPAVSVARWAVGSHAGPLYGVVVSDAVRAAVGYSSHWRFEEEHRERRRSFSGSISEEPGGSEATGSVLGIPMPLFRLVSVGEGGTIESDGDGGPGSARAVSSEISVEVSGSCAFPGTNQWECLPHAHRAAEELPGAKPGWEDGKLSRFHERASASCCRAFSPGFEDGWEVDFLVYESGRNRIYQGRVLSIVLIAAVAGCWVWELNLVSEDEPVQDTMLVWSFYAWAVSPVVVLLASLYTKLYKRRPAVASTVGAALSGLIWTTFAVAVPSPRGDVGCVGLLLLLLYVLFSGVCCSAKAALRSGALAAWMLCATLFVRWNQQDADTGSATNARDGELPWAMVAITVCLPLLVIGTLSALRREHARRLAYGWDRESEAAVVAAAGIGSGRRVETSRVLLLRLPAAVMRRVFDGDRALYDDYAKSAVLRVEVAGFDELCGADEEQDETEADAQGRVLATRGLIVGLALLHDLLIIAEQLALRHGVILLTTDGPSLTVVSGAVSGGTNRPLAGEVSALAEFALDLAENIGMWIASRWGGAEALSLGIGLRQGLAVNSSGGGLLGYARFAYGVWGPAVSEAAALCDAATLNTTACNDAARALLPTTPEEAAALESGAARCVFKFDHRTQQASQTRRRRGRVMVAVSEHHTLIERNEAASAALEQAQGRSSSTRSLVSVELGFSPTPTPQGLGRSPQPHLPHSPVLTIDEMGEEEELSRPSPVSAMGLNPASGYVPAPRAGSRTSRATGTVEQLVPHPPANPAPAQLVPQPPPARELVPQPPPERGAQQSDGAAADRTKIVRGRRSYTAAQSGQDDDDDLEQLDA